MNPKRLIESF